MGGHRCGFGSRQQARRPFSWSRFSSMAFPILASTSNHGRRGRETPKTIGYLVIHSKDVYRVKVQQQKRRERAREREIMAHLLTEAVDHVNFNYSVTDHPTMSTSLVISCHHTDVLPRDCMSQPSTNAVARYCIPNAHTVLL